MTARVKTIGFRELALDAEKAREVLKNPERATKQLAALMRKHVHVLTGHLKSTIYHKYNVAGAKAAYAGFVEEMEPLSEFAYATRAIKDFNMDKWSDEVMEAFQ